MNNPKILSYKPFGKDTYKIVHTKSSLKLNATEKNIVNNYWKEILQNAKSKRIQQWDGTFYRIENIQDIVSGCKELKFSTMKYSEVRGIKDDPILSSKFKAHNTSTTSLIRTSDGYFIFGVRNKNTVRKSNIDLIGGGLQESELVVNTFSDVFKNEFKEIREEVGLIEDDIRSMQGIGIVESTTSNVLFVFFTQLNKSKDEVESIFYRNIDDEMEGLKFIEEELLKEYLNDIGDYRPLTGELYFRNLGLDYLSIE